MYSAKAGRFLQPDPIGYADGMNFYGYVGGDPMNRRDPSGLQEADLSECMGNQMSGMCAPVADITVIGHGCNYACRLQAEVEFQRWLNQEMTALSLETLESHGGDHHSDLHSFLLGAEVVAAAGHTYFGGLELVEVSNGRWRGLNTKWYPLSWGGNQYTGPRSAVLRNARAFGAVARGSFYLGSAVAVVDATSAAANGDVAGVGKASANFSMGYIGMAGGWPGLIAAGTYFVVDFGVGIEVVTGPVTDGLCYATANC
jgi:hypothetical protein